MIREGDIYTYNLPDDNKYDLRACYRPFVIVEIGTNDVTAVPLTMNVSNFVDEKRVYTNLTVDGNTKEICILSDLPIVIPQNKLVKKIAHVDSGVFREIKSKMSEFVTTTTQTDHEEGNDIAGIVLGTDVNTKEVLRILEGMTSKKAIWRERIIAFVLGALASIVATLIISL